MYGKPLMYVVKIDEISPIENADKIELAKVMDYSIIVKKNEFAPGDLALYVEVDSLLPNGLEGADNVRANELTSSLKSMDVGSDDYNTAKAELDELTAKSKYPYFEFLRQRKFKIKAMKMRGVISQGILFKPSDLGITDYKLGQDFSTQFNVTEIVQDEEEAGVNTSKKDNFIVRWLMKYAWFRAWRKRKNVKEVWDPTFPGKSDEENVQKIFSKMKEKYGDKEWVATEKLEGQNITVYSEEVKGLFGKKKKRIGVCSRTRELNPKGNSKAFWDTVKRIRFDEKVKNIPGEWFIRGEHIGPGIQGNIYKLPRTEIRIFDMYKKIDGQWQKLPWNEMVVFSELYDIPLVPLLDEHYKLPDTVQEMLKESDKPTCFGNDLKHKREGFVLRLKDDYNVSFKVKNPFYEI